MYFAQPQKGLAHRALADIIESVRELAYYRQTLFVDAPGPSQSQAQAAATRVADLMAPGQVVLKLAVKGFGVRLQDA